MKIIAIIKKIIVGIAGVAFFTFVIALTILLLNYNDYGVTQIDNVSLIKIREEISSDNYKKGDLVFVEQKRIERINIGDEVFLYELDDTGVVSIDLGTVGELHPDEDALSLENGATYSMEFVVGTPTRVYNKLGTYLSIMESRWGFLFIVLVPSFLIFIYSLYALIVEIKYGKEEVID